MTPRPYSMGSLTIAKVEMISKELGLPSSRWDEADNLLVMALVYAAVEDIPVDEVKALTVEELMSRFATEEEPDPTPASA